MKRLYARLVLWLIRPALEAYEVRPTNDVRRTLDEFNDRISAALSQGGVFRRK